MQLPDQSPAQRTQLIRYTQFQFAIGAIIGLLALAGGWWAGSQPLLLGGVITVIYTLSVLPAILFARHGRLRQAVLVVIGGLYFVAFFALLVAPVALPVALLVLITAPILALPYFDLREMVLISASCTVVALVVTVMARFVQLFPPLPEPLTSIIIVIDATATTAIILLLIVQFANQRAVLLTRLSEANSQLIGAQVDLERQVADRTAELHAALDEVQRQSMIQSRLLEDLTRQREAVRELSVPVLPISHEAVVMPLIGSMDTERLQQLQARALAAITANHARDLILDITGVPVVDTAVARGILATVQAAHLLGARVILVGIRPEVAQTVVGLGVDFAGLTTFATVREAIRAINDAPVRR